MTNERAAVGFVEAVGFCSTFYRFPEGVACLWEAVVGRSSPRWPRRSHHDAGIGLTWDLKDTLPSKKRVYYGKLLKGRPLLVALELFPAFYAQARGRQRARDYREEYAAGRMSHTARRLMDALVREHPQYTRGLRRGGVPRGVGRLVPTGALRADCVGDGWPGRWLVHADGSTSRSREARRVCE